MTAHPRRFSGPDGTEVLVFDDAEAAAEAAADRIEQAIVAAVADRGEAVLGLATGGTPVPVYRRLVERHRAGRLSFGRTTTYNLDEYYPIGPLDPQSYHFYMDRHVISAVDLAPNRAHIPDGTAPESAIDELCLAYDRWIADDGGLDLQLLGLGRNGHIGFNEPSDLPVDRALRLPTRPVALHEMTIADAADAFGGPDRVPRRALTVGTATILSSRSILMLAFGAKKAEAVARSLTGPITAEVPASLLRSAGDRVTWMLDREAASALPTP